METASLKNGNDQQGQKSRAVHQNKTADTGQLLAYPPLETNGLLAQMKAAQVGQSRLAFAPPSQMKPEEGETENNTGLPDRKYIGNVTNYQGFVNAENGIILHGTPSPSDEAYQTKRNNPEEYVIKQNQPLTVMAEGNEDNEGWVLVKAPNGEVGWIERRYISKEPKIESQKLFPSYTVQKGDNLESLINRYYEDYPFATGNDRRTVALAIYLYNKDKPGAGIYRNNSKYRNAGSWKDSLDPWMKETRANYQSVELYAGGKVLLPPAKFIQEMRRLGEIEKRPDFVNDVIEGGRVIQGFIEGVGTGFWKALSGAVEDLYNLIVDIFTGEIFGQIAEMFDTIMDLGLEGIWDMIKDLGTSTWEEIKAAWDNPNPYERGKFFGGIIGMILFEVVLAILTAGIGTAVKNSARVTKIMKLFPSWTNKIDTPEYKDRYNSIDKPNDNDLDGNRNRESDTDRAKNAKALMAAKAYVVAQDAKNPSPDVDLVLKFINNAPGMKLSGGKRYKAERNGKGEGHFKIYYNPPVVNDYTEGVFGDGDRDYDPREDERFEDLAKEEGKTRPSDRIKGEREAEGILKAEKNGLVEKPTRPKSGGPDLDFEVDGPPPYKWCDIKSPVDPKLRSLKNQADDIAKNIFDQKAGAKDVLHVVDLNQIPLENRADFMKTIIDKVGSAEGIAFVD